MAAIGAVGAFVSGPAAVAGTPAPAAACSTGQMCVWSGTNYTGQMATVPDESWDDCISAASLGLSAIRSAQRNGVPCSLQAALYADSVCGRSTEPEYVENQTPNISPAALSLYRFMIPC
ncbi:MAG: peptidase inhibitor family I36 protein [Gammaproteobacteria bacterium]